MSGYIPTTPLLVEAVRRHGSTTIGELATELDLSREQVSANLGGLHDNGYLTRYRSGLESRVTWIGPDDLYVRTCLEHAGSTSSGSCREDSE